MADTLLKERPSTLTFDAFVRVYGRIYEHSPWVAEAAYAQKQERNIDTAESLHAVMKIAVGGAGEEKQLALIRAHPDLVCTPADDAKLSRESKEEQARSGLKACTPEEFSEFQKLSEEYKTRFGFPFVIAVKGLGRQDILSTFRARVDNEKPEEFKTALIQIHQIAYFRLMQLVR